MKTVRNIVFLFLVLSFAAACGGGGGGSSDSGSSDGGERSWVVRWNHIAIDASGLDHEPGQAGEQLGPTRASRAIAIVQIAVADAVAAITGKFQPYLPTSPAPAGTSMQAAVAQAAHDALIALFPSQAATFNAKLADDLAAIPEGPGKQNGIALGKATAANILSVRSNDGSQTVVKYDFLSGPGFWQQDPLNPQMPPLGQEWKHVIPFVLASAHEFRAPPPPALDSEAYAIAYADTLRFGGDGITTPTERTEEETFIGEYWAYDGTPSLCAPPRLYNQIVVQIAQERGADVVEMARLLALVNIALADAAISSWESKFHYNFWRPITAIREGESDGNPATIGDPSFVPRGAPGSNAGFRFTPPFPTYPSGHATFGGAAFEVLRDYYGTDKISFTFVSDEYNGVTLGTDGQPRELKPRSFSSLSEAEFENGRSRVYLGIHFQFDSDEGIVMGRQIGDAVMQSVYAPIR